MGQIRIGSVGDGINTLKTDVAMDHSDSEGAKLTAVEISKADVTWMRFGVWGQYGH